MPLAGDIILALERRNPELSLGRLLVVLCSLSFASYVGSYMRIPMVPLFARELRANLLEVGLINSLFLLLAGGLSFPLGVLSDRWGRKVLVVGGFLMYLVSGLLLVMAQAPWQLLVISVLFGMGLAAVGPTLMAYVADISPATHLGRSYGWYTMAIYAGMSLGPAVGGRLAQWLGFRPLFLVSALFMGVIAVLAQLLLPSGEKERSVEASVVRGAGQMAAVLKNRPLLGCWLATLGGCFGLGMFITFVPLHTHQQGLRPGEIGLVFAVQGVVNALSRLPFGRLSDRVARRQHLAFMGFLCMGVTLAAFGWCQTLGEFVGVAVAMGAAMGLGFTPTGALIAETVPSDSKGLAMGGYNTCIYLGMTASSATLGAVIGRWGFKGGYLLTALVIAAASVGFYLLIRGFSGQNSLSPDDFP